MAVLESLNCDVQFVDGLASRNDVVWLQRPSTTDLGNNFLRTNGLHESQK